MATRLKELLAAARGVLGSTKEAAPGQIPMSFYFNPYNQLKAFYYQDKRKYGVIYIYTLWFLVGKTVGIWKSGNDASANAEREKNDRIRSEKREAAKAKRIAALQESSKQLELA